MRHETEEHRHQRYSRNWAAVAGVLYAIDFVLVGPEIVFDAITSVLTLGLAAFGEVPVELTVDGLILAGAMFATHMAHHEHKEAVNAREARLSPKRGVRR